LKTAAEFLHTTPLENLTQQSKASQFSAMISSQDLEFIMEAHDGLSARIVEEAGFKGIWASGLSMSAAMGVRDNNEASWTQVLEVLEFMSDATTIPILVDGDTGWGNFNNLRRAVGKLCQRGIAGICIEDKLFPKTNSFIGSNQPLADMDEFCGKIKAGKDSQTDPDFQIIARVEALIAGWGLDEALRRAEAYRQAGADAILIHSKKSNADEIFAFTKEWANRSPVVVVPTKYYSTPTDDFRNANVSLAIWANHNLRTAITAMRETSRQIYRDQHLQGVESRVVSVSEVFDLTGNEELAEAEKRYLPEDVSPMKAIILAASRGEGLGELTASRPKCMIDVRGQPLLKRLVRSLADAQVRDVTVVRGYCKDVINLPSINTVDNDFYATTGEVASLSVAVSQLNGDAILAYGDILFRQFFLDMLLSVDGDIVVTVDALWQQGIHSDDERIRDFVTCSKPYSSEFLDDAPVELTGIGQKLDKKYVSGEWIGLARLTANGCDIVRKEIDAMKADGSLQKSGLPDLFARIVKKGHKVRVVYVSGEWMDVDDAADLTAAGKFL